MKNEHEALAAFTAWADQLYGSTPLPVDDPKHIPQHERFLSYWQCWLAALASPAAEPVQALTMAQITRLYQNSPAGDDATSFAAFVRLWRLFESVSLASPSATKEAKAGWIPVSERMPESGVKVLACYVNRAGKPRRICAEWIAAKSRESGSDSDIGEYDEADDTFYDPQGWYECIDSWDVYSSVAVTEGAISHWMPLPPAPEGAA